MGIGRLAKVYAGVVFVLQGFSNAIEDQSQIESKDAPQALPLLILFPIYRIGEDVIIGCLVIFFIADDVLIIITLPKTDVFGVCHNMIPFRNSGFK
jgi:hypothetical protein